MNSIASQKQIIIRSEYERIVMGEVYIPMHLDTFNTTMTAEEIKRIAYSFMQKGMVDSIDEMHNGQKSGCHVVESFIARTGDPDFVPGSWVLGVKINNDIVWDKVTRGEYNGFSIGGKATRERALVSLTKVRDMDLLTEPSLPGILPAHRHALHLIFGANRELVPTWTAPEQDHQHQVLYTTATEPAMDHNHRFVVI